MFAWLKNLYWRIRYAFAGLKYQVIAGGADLRTTGISQLDNAIPELWDENIRLDSIKKAFWDKFEGAEGSSMPIIIRNDFTKMPGDTLRINVLSQLLYPGVTGESTLEGNEERLSLSQFTVSLILLRHAVAFTQLGQLSANFDSVMAAGNLLSTWLAVRKDRDMFEQLIETNPPTVLYAGNATTRASLGADDLFTPVEIDRIRLALERQGALPIRTVVDGKQEIDWYGVVISEVDRYRLQSDPTWQQAQRDAGVRGDENRLFSGALGFWNGVWVYSYSAVKGSGRFGSLLRPEARLQTALNSSETTTIQVGPATQDTTVNYTDDFPSSGTLRIDSEDIAYTGVTNATFTGITRAQNGTTGAAHSTGALITLRNLGRALGFGAEVSARVWGMYPTRIRQTQDYGNREGIGIQAYYGQRTIINTQSEVPNAVLMETYSPNPGTI